MTKPPSSATLKVIVVLFKIFQVIIITGLSLYASVLGIISFNSEVKSLLKLPETLEKRSEIMIEQLEKIKMLESTAASTTEQLKQITETQNNVISSINSMANDANSLHAKSMRNGGEYIDLKIRVTKAEKENGSANFISYDINSKFFREELVLGEKAAYHDYFIYLKNPDDRNKTIITAIIGEKTGKGLKGKEKSEITFRVSPAIFKSLGGDPNRSELLDVEARLVKGK